MAETEKDEAVSSEAESSVHISNNSPTKRRRGRPQGSKKLKVCVTDVNLMELVSGISNGGSTHSQRSRGRPKLSSTKHTAEEGSVDADNPVQTHRSKGRPKRSKKQISDSLVTDHTPKKRGRPKKSQSPEKAAAEDLANGSNTAKMGRGRPKGSVKRKSESLTSGDEDEGRSVKLRKRGRPKGSLNKKPRLEKEVNSEEEVESDESRNSTKRGRGGLRKVELNNTEVSTEDASNGVSDTPRRGRGRPRKNTEQKSLDQQEPVTDGSQPPKRGRGRPKGSLNKKPPVYRVQVMVGRPRRIHVPLAIEKRGRSRKQPAKRGRPRKYPLPSPEELKKPKVWKPLGRPRKYPRVDPPEGAAPAPRRSRGRPRKSESKKGAHLRKSLPAAPSQPRNPNGGTPRKRGRPPSAGKSEGVTPRKRGRPKGSLNKNKARSETQLNNSTHLCLSEKRESSAGLDDGERAEQQALPVEHASKTDGTLNQA